MEVLIIRNNKKVMDLNTKRLGSLLKIFLTTITVDTSIIALVKLITILNELEGLCLPVFCHVQKLKKIIKYFWYFWY